MNNAVGRRSWIRLVPLRAVLCARGAGQRYWRETGCEEDRSATFRVNWHTHEFADYTGWLNPSTKGELHMIDSDGKPYDPLERTRVLWTVRR